MQFENQQKTTKVIKLGHEKSEIHVKKQNTGKGTSYRHINRR
jgi:hypothetical protein